MTLPPVVSDPEWCRESETSYHDWEQTVTTPHSIDGRLVTPDICDPYEICRYCGGRKP